MATTIRRLQRTLPQWMKIQYNNELIGFQNNRKIKPIQRLNFQRNVSSFPSNYQLAEKLKKPLDFSDVGISSIKRDNKMFKISFKDGSEGKAPYVWLRDNCQCDSCFDHMALARKSLLIDLNVDIEPRNIEYDTDSVTVTWSDSHISTFDAQWLMERAFIPKSMQFYQNFHKIAKEPWGKDVVIDRFNYDKMLQDEHLLLSWLITLERKGIALVENCPPDVESAPKLIDTIGFVKGTHFGRRSPVKKREYVSHLAYRNMALGLHNDLPYYNYVPGLVFLNTIKKHEGIGGGNLLSDGLLGVDLFRKSNPEEFKLLSEQAIYFWDKGLGDNSMEKKEFYKINKSPVIELDPDGDLHVLRISTWGRDSHLFLSHDLTYKFYDALLKLNKIIYNNSITYKMESGEMLVLDNYRCLHGREEYSSQSTRHLETSYMDWDEAKCTRRCLQEKLYKYNVN